MDKREKAALIVIFTDLFSVTVKFVLANVTGSLALLADAWHSFADLFTSTCVWFAIRLDRLKEVDSAEEKSNGNKGFLRHAAWEKRISVLIGIFLFVVGLGVFYKAFAGTGLLGIHRPLLAAAIVTGLIFVSYLRFCFETSVGKEQGSPALAADGYHARVDMYVLGLVLAALLAERWGFPLDRFAAGLIGVLILFSATRLICKRTLVWVNEGQHIAPDSRSAEDNFLLFCKEWILFVWQLLSGWLIQVRVIHDLTYRRRFFRLTSIGLVVFIALAYICSGVYIVGPRQEAVIELWGNPINRDNPKEPGLHYFYPYPIGEVRKVDTRSIRRLQVGFKSAKRQGMILWTNIHYLKEYPLLAGDNTIIDVAAHVHYRVLNPGDYLYEAAKPERLLEDIIYDSLRAEVGRREFFPSITNQRRALEGKLIERTKKEIKKLKLGIEVLHIFLKDLHPPLEVAFAFEDVVSAQEDKETFLEEARGYKKEQLPEAQGQAYTVLKQGKQFAKQIELRASGKAEVFSRVGEIVSKHPDLNRFRLRSEALATALRDSQKYVIDDKQFSHPVDLILAGSKAVAIEKQLDKEENSQP
jgi:modulator of FtsH protease HflK